MLHLRMDSCDQRCSDIGTDIGNPLDIGEHVQKFRTCDDGAGSPAQPLQMILLELRDQIVDNLFQRFDMPRVFNIAIREGCHRNVQDPFDQILQNLKLSHRFIRKIGLLSLLQYIDRMVAQAFEFRKAGKILILDDCMPFLADMSGKLDQIIAHPVSHQIDYVLIRADQLIPLLGILLYLLKSPDRIQAGEPQHLPEDLESGIESKRRSRKENRVETFQLMIRQFIALLLFIPDDLPAGLLIDGIHREHQDGAGKIKDCIGIGDSARIHRLIPDPVQPAKMVSDKNARKNQDGLAQVKKNIDDTDALRVRLCPDVADDGSGHAVSEIDADKYRVDLGKDQLSRHGKRLQDTDRGGRALKDECDARSYQIADKRILPENGEESVDNTGLRQGLNRGSHIHQS